MKNSKNFKLFKKLKDFAVSGLKRRMPLCLRFKGKSNLEN